MCPPKCWGTGAGDLWLAESPPPISGDTAKRLLDSFTLLNL